MADRTGAERLRQELQELDAEIARLRRTTDELKKGGGSAGEVEDEEEAASDLAGVQEEEAVLAALEARRDSLARRLDDA